MEKCAETMMRGFSDRLSVLVPSPYAYQKALSLVPAYVTTKEFLEVFGFATLRDLPDIERLEDEGLLRRPPIESDLDDALGFGDEDAEVVNEVQDDWNASSSAE
jgi:hypothetical protein